MLILWLNSLLLIYLKGRHPHWPVSINVYITEGIRLISQDLQRVYRSCVVLWTDTSFGVQKFLRS